MKMLPVQLSLNPPLGLWSDVLWRCPPAPPNQLAELKTQLPSSLPSDPKLWGREDVGVFLRFCEREFDLPKVDHDLFQMNGKALCLLTRSDFGHRCPGAGDVLHNVLQMLIIESHMMQWHLPNSPVTPTSRYPLSPQSHAPTAAWPPLVSDGQFNNHHMHQFMAPNSVTLSPPPSVDSQANSPPQIHDQNGTNSISTANVNNSATASTNKSNTCNQNNTLSNSSNHSDSEEENCNELPSSYSKKNTVTVQATAALPHYESSPPSTPIIKDLPQSIRRQITNNIVNSWSQTQQQCQKFRAISNNGGSLSAPTTPSYLPVKREFFAENSETSTKNVSSKRDFISENSEPNTNGRLLWDFLQQLLNDRNQKYSDLIAWKCRDTGVFKIVDPAGLAKLWGIQKNHLSMNYDKMSRALRYYYRVNILRKVQGERHCYQFLRNPSELKNIKNISLLRQTVITSSSSGNVSNSNSITTQSSSQSIITTSTNANSTNWSLKHQNVCSPMQQSTMVSQAIPHRLPSRSNHQLVLPSISSSAAAAAVAAAAAAAYGPSPNSPLFMHAINGAFHYLSSGPGQTSNSPILPSTPSEKLQFNGLSLENNVYNDEMMPTDLSVSGSEKRPYSKSTVNEECYPLIRNSDGLTTIKLVRYNDTESLNQQTEESPKSESSDVDERDQSNSVESKNNDSNDNF